MANEHRDPNCVALRERLRRLADEWSTTADLMDPVHRQGAHLIDRMRQQLLRAIDPKQCDDDEQDDLPF